MTFQSKQIFLDVKVCYSRLNNYEEKIHLLACNSCKKLFLNKKLDEKTMYKTNNFTKKSPFLELAIYFTRKYARFVILGILICHLIKLMWITIAAHDY